MLLCPLEIGRVRSMIPEATSPFWTGAALKGTRMLPLTPAAPMWMCEAAALPVRPVTVTR
jgi:hypothetical protein